MPDDPLNGKPQLNGSPTCACQFTDWSSDGNGNHVPGYTEVTNGPLRTLEAMSPNPITYQNSGHPRWVGTVPIVSSQSSFNQWFNDSAGSSLRTRTRSERWSWRRTGGCTYTFQRPHYCGDGILDPEEQCDLGNQNGVSGSGCGTDCKRIIG